MSRRVSQKIQEAAKRTEDHFYSEYILGQTIQDYELDHGQYIPDNIRKALILSNGWYSKKKYPPKGHSDFVQNIIKEASSLLSQDASLQPLIDEISYSVYKNWCWLAEKPEDITSICQDALIQQQYGDGSWDTVYGYNYIVGICFEFSGG